MRVLQPSDLDEAPCGFLVVTDTGHIVAVNTTLVRMLGYVTKEDLTGKPLDNILTIAGRIFYQTHLYPLVNLHGEVREIFLNLQKNNGGHYPVLCNAVRKREDEAAAIHFIIIPSASRGRYEDEILRARRRAERALEENTELIQAKKALEEARFLLDNRLQNLTHINDTMIQLGHAISHELQEPMRKLALKSDALLQVINDGLSPGIADALHSIHAESTRLRTFAGNLEQYIGLSLAKEKSVEVDLGPLIERACLHAMPAGDPDALVLQMTPLPIIEGYPRQLETLFARLFETLLQHRPLNQCLVLTLQSHTGQANSVRQLPGHFHYSEVLRLVFSVHGLLGAQAAPIVDAINKKIDIGTITRYVGIAAGKTIAYNHRGALSGAIHPGEVTAITLTLPMHRGFTGE